MTNIVPKFINPKLTFQTNDERVKKEVLRFIDEWNNELDFFVAKTSGSTGKPKEVLLKKEIAIASAKMTGTFFNFHQNTNIALCLSTESIGGKMQILRALLFDLELIILKTTKNPIQDLIFKIDFISMVPLQVQEILKQNKEKFNLCKSILIGGAQLNSKLNQELQQLPSDFYESFGMSETYSHVAIRKINSENKHFQALPGITFSAMKENLCIHAPSLGLLKLQTNDCIELIDNQRFIFLGRSDFAINSAGLKFHPEILEQKIENFISENFFILGEKNDEYGEIVCIYLETKHSLKKENELKKIFDKQFSRYEKPKKIYFVPNFIKTESGKINKLATQKASIEH